MINMSTVQLSVLPKFRENHSLEFFVVFAKIDIHNSDA